MNRQHEELCESLIKGGFPNAAAAIFELAGVADCWKSACEYFRGAWGEELHRAVAAEVEVARLKMHADAMAEEMILQEPDRSPAMAYRIDYPEEL